MPGRGAGGISLDGVNPRMTQQCPVTREWYLTGRGEPRDNAAMPGRGAGGISLAGVNPGITQQCPVAARVVSHWPGEPRDDAAMPGCVAGCFTTCRGEPQDNAAMSGRGAGGISPAGLTTGWRSNSRPQRGWYLTGRVNPGMTQQCPAAAQVVSHWPGEPRRRCNARSRCG